MAYDGLVNLLVEGLALKHPPIALAFLDEPPPGVAHYAEAVPSACAFWRAAEHSLFYASAEDHSNCPIGALTLGLPVPAEVLEQAKTLVENMDKWNYLKANEADKLPRVTKAARVIVYGPLKEFATIEPDVALLICSPYQAMLLSEATGTACWTAMRKAHALGRPACAVISSALDSESATMSLACTGARTFARLKEEELILAVPARALAALEGELVKILDANARMKTFYEEHQSRFPSF